MVSVTWWMNQAVAKIKERVKEYNEERLIPSQANKTAINKIKKIIDIMLKSFFKSKAICHV